MRTSMEPWAEDSILAAAEKRVDAKPEHKKSYQYKAATAPEPAPEDEGLCQGCVHATAEESMTGVRRWWCAYYELSHRWVPKCAGFTEHPSPRSTPEDR